VAGGPIADPLASPWRARLDLEPPTNSEHVRAMLRGIRRTVGAAPTRKAPVLAKAARAVVLSAPHGLNGLRDRALLLLGFAGAFRRSISRARNDRMFPTLTIVSLAT
jgi:hypothetical protein